MILLPIAERELRVAARSRRTYWSRAGAGIVVLLLALVIFHTYEKFGRSKVGGQQVFAALAYLALAYSLFAGAALTADCISREKRDETLGLLFLTDLKGYDVILGKLFSTSLRSIYGLLATFPILSLPLLLGGVRASEFWRVILVVLNTLLLSLSTGLLVSTLFRRERVTTHVASILMLLLALIPSGLSTVLNAVGGGAPLWVDPGLVSPLYALQSAFEPAYRFAGLMGWNFWAALTLQFTLGLVLLARASWLLPYSWQQSASSAAPVPESQNGGALREQLQAERRRLLDQNPYYWLASRGRAITVGMTLLIGLVALWGLYAWNERESFAAVQGVGILLVALVTRLLIPFAAAQRLAEDKQSGALDLILTTPLTVDDIIAGQWRAIWKKLGWPILSSLVLYAFLLFGSGAGGLSNEEEVMVRRFTAVCFFLLTIADAMALGWLGMWSGLCIRQVPNGAALCWCKVVLPHAIIPMAFIWIHGFNSADEYLRTNPYLIPALWLGIGLMMDFVWIHWARQNLIHRFRAAATDRFQHAEKAVP